MFGAAGVEARWNAYSQSPLLMLSRWCTDGGITWTVTRREKFDLSAVGMSLSTANFTATAPTAAQKWTEVTAMRWIEDHDYIKCPKCGVMVKRDFTFFDVGDWNFCPNCGEPMEGGAENAAD